MSEPKKQTQSQREQIAPTNSGEKPAGSRKDKDVFTDPVGRNDDNVIGKRSLDEGNYSTGKPKSDAPNARLNEEQGELSS
jgi:hypothetical protein